MLFRFSIVLIKNMAEAKYALPSARFPIMDEINAKIDKDFEAWRQSPQFEEEVDKQFSNIRDRVHSCIKNRHSCKITNNIFDIPDFNKAMAVCQTVVNRIKQHNPGYRGQCNDVYNEYGSRYVRILITPNFK